MHRVRRLSLFLIVLALVPCLMAAERPNILWLVSEDTTTMLGCYGDSFARTPALDKLAKEGVLFERCFAQPVCAPSRFALITGMPAAACGPAEHMRGTGKLPSHVKGFPSFLRKAGYYTSNNAKTDYNSTINLEETWDACDRGAHYKNRNAEQPFFSVFNHEATHESSLFPQGEPTWADPAKVRVPPYLPDTPEIRADIARNYERIALMDSQIAAKLEELEKSGLAEDTIVFYYGDNGGVFPRSKRFLHRSGTHVPLIVRFPSKWRHLGPAAPGSRISNPISFIDFAPTVFALAGVTPPDYMKGRPFLGSLIATNDFVFTTRDRMDERYDIMRSVVNDRWLYIRNFRPDLPYVQPTFYMFQARGYQSWARLAQEGKLSPATAQFWGSKPVEELYDLQSDPDNVRNLAAVRAHGAQLELMRNALKERVIEVRDNGFIPEGSASEGYDACRAPGAYPVEAVFSMACTASDRNPAKVSELIAGLKHPNESVRWWAAQGCAMLGKKAEEAEGTLLNALEDSSGAVQVAAAEALITLGKPRPALAILERWLTNTVNPPFALQAANVMDRAGETARPLLPSIKAVMAKPREGKGVWTEQNLLRLLPRMVEKFEGKSEGTSPVAPRKKRPRRDRASSALN